MKTVYDVIKYPLITEKLTLMQEADENKIGFIVDVKANKCEIKKAVETIFDDVKVKSVRIINMKPKKKRYGRYMGERPGFKKAYVTLTADSKKINFVE
jgi:large subunit ribosomal protein L23